MKKPKKPKYRAPHKHLIHAIAALPMRRVSDPVYLPQPDERERARKAADKRRRKGARRLRDESWGRARRKRAA